MTAPVLMSPRMRARQALARSPLLRVRRWWGRDRLRVLAYHEIRDQDTFVAQLDHLQAEYHPVDLDGVIDWLDGAPLPPNAVLVTFDDGHRSWIDIAAPLLESRGIPAVAFVVSGVLDTRLPYWWEEVEALTEGDDPSLVRAMKRMPDGERQARLDELRRGKPAVESDTNLSESDLIALEQAGIEIGNHTVTHPLLDKCPVDTVEWEIREAHRRLSEVVGRPLRAFAYPNGNWSPPVREVVEATGHRVGFLFDHREQPRRRADAMLLSRIRVNSWDAIEEFALRVSGLHPSLLAARGRIRAADSA